MPKTFLSMLKLQKRIAGMLKNMYGHAEKEHHQVFQECVMYLPSVGGKVGTLCLLTFVFLVIVLIGVILCMLCCACCSCCPGNRHNNSNITNNVNLLQPGSLLHTFHLGSWSHQNTHSGFSIVSSCV